MRLILIFILGFIVLSLLLTLVGPLLVLGIGAMLAYYAYQNLVKSNNSVLSTIWWVIIGITGVKIFAGALPGLVFIGVIVAVCYFAFRKTYSQSQSNDEMNPDHSSMYSEYQSFEAEWREITNK